MHSLGYIPMGTALLSFSFNFFPFILAGSYVVMQVDLKAQTLTGLFDVFQRDKDIIQQTISNKTDEPLGRELSRLKSAELVCRRGGFLVSK